MKYCKNCGEKFDGNEKLCKSCAQQREVDNTESIEKDNEVKETDGKNLVKIPPDKKFLKPLIAAILIVILVLIAIPKFFSESIDINHVCVVKDNEKIYTIYKGKVIDSINTSNTSNFTKDLYNKNGIILEEVDGTLWFFDEKGKITKIDERVKSAIISDNGDGVVYTKESENDYLNELYLYNCKNDSKELVCDNIYFEDSIFGVSISPDGKSISYVSDYDLSKNEFQGYISINGKEPVSIGSNNACIAISNDGKYVYYTNNNSLYVQSGKDKNKLVADLDESNNIILLNSDYSEIIFNYKDKANISINGKDKISLLNENAIHMITKDKIGEIRYNITNGITILTSVVNSFKNQVLRTEEDSIYYINNKLESNKISSNASVAYLSQNKKEVVLMENSNIYIVEDIKDENKKVKIASNVKNFVFSPDFSKIYYVNDSEELWYIEDKGEGVKICDYVYAYALEMVDDTVYFLCDYSNNVGSLYYCNNGKKKVKVNEVYDVNSMIADKDNIYVVGNYNSEDNTFDFYSGKNKTFKKVLEGVTVLTFKLVSLFY